MKAIPMAAEKPSLATVSSPRKFRAVTPRTSIISPTKYLESRCSMSPMAPITSFSTLSGTSEPTIFRNSLSSLMKKKEMNMTQKSPIPKLPRAEATEPTTVPIELSEPRLKALLTQSTRITCSLKSLPSFGYLCISQLFAVSSN